MNKQVAKASDSVAIILNQYEVEAIASALLDRAADALTIRPSMVQPLMDLRQSVIDQYAKKGK